MQMSPEEGKLHSLFFSKPNFNAYNFPCIQFYLRKNSFSTEEAANLKKESYKLFFLNRLLKYLKNKKYRNCKTKNKSFAWNLNTSLRFLKNKKLSSPLKKDQCTKLSWQGIWSQCAGKWHIHSFNSFAQSIF